MEDLKRVHSIDHHELTLENQNGPLERQLLRFVVSDLYESSRQADAETLNLVLDDAQLSRLKSWLLALDLPEETQLQPSKVQ